MASEDDAIAARVEAEMRVLCSERDIQSHSTLPRSVAHTWWRSTSSSAPGSRSRVPAQDGLRERIWAAVGRPIHEAWLTINITADPRWA